MRKPANVSQAQWISSLLLITVVGGFLIAVPAGILASRIAPWALPDDAYPANDLSYLEGRKYTSAPIPSGASIFSGSFQSDAESFVADSIPYRDTALLINAALQRSVIEVAAEPFGFKTLPGFFDSSYNLSDNGKFYITAESLTPSEEEAVRDQTQEAALAYANFAARHPANSCLVYHVAYSQMSPDNRTIPLVSNAWTSEDRRECFEPFMGGAISYSDNADLVDANYYFGTDHHWTIQGAYKTYCDLAHKLGFSPLAFSEDDLLTFGTPFYGTLSRYALNDAVFPDFISDYAFNYPDYEITVNGKHVEERGDKSRYQRGEADPSKYMDRHSEYFGSSETEVIYRNPDNPQGKTLLVVRDSYMSDIEPMVAYHYSTVYFLDLRNDDAPQLETFLSEHPADDILFMGSSMLTWESVVSKIDPEND